MKRLLFVFNPRSGKEQIRTKLLDILDIFVKAGCRIQVHVTQAQGDAEAVVKEYGGAADLIVCSGGDGTLKETVSGLMAFPKEQRPPFGYIPAGSTNDFASSLGISKKMTQAALDAVSGEEFFIDVGYATEDEVSSEEAQYFVYVAAFGAFTEVSYSTPQEKKNLLGHQAYMLEAVKRITNLKSYPMRFEWDGNVLEEEFILGMITNTTRIGGFKGLAGPDVALDDGEFEVLLVRRPRTPKDIRSIASYLILKEGEDECIRQFRTREIKIISPSPTDWTMDGEFGGSRQTFTVRNCQKAVRICRNREEVVETAGISAENS